MQLLKRILIKILKMKFQKFNCIRNVLQMRRMMLFPVSNNYFVLSPWKLLDETKRIWRKWTELLCAMVFVFCCHNHNTFFLHFIQNLFENKFFFFWKFVSWERMQKFQPQNYKRENQTIDFKFFSSFYVLPSTLFIQFCSNNNSLHKYITNETIHQKHSYSCSQRQ